MLKKIFNKSEKKIGFLKNKIKNIEYSCQV